MKVESYEVVDTHKLQVGDVVWYYGSRLRITSRTVDTTAFFTRFDSRGTVVAQTELLEGSPEFRNWTIQGNGNAKWVREIH